MTQYSPNSATTPIVTTFSMGQVGGFPLRLSWLSRLVLCAHERENVVDFDSLSLKMGIGVNMAKSLRFWALVAGIVQPCPQNSGEYRISERGANLFSPVAGIDPYAERDETGWLVHWLTTSNIGRFTASGWLFHRFAAASFTHADALSAMLEHVKACAGSERQSYAKGTAQVDLDTALRMYASGGAKTEMESDLGVFKDMRLFSVSREKSETRYKRLLRDQRPRVPSRLIVYALISAMTASKSSKARFTSLYGDSRRPTLAPGLALGFTRDGFYEAIEKSASEYGRFIALTRMPDGDDQIAINDNRLSRMAEEGAGPADEFYFSCFQRVKAA